MQVMHVYLAKVESKFRADFLPEILLNKLDLTGIFCQETNAVDDIALLTLSVVAFHLKEYGVGFTERFLFLRTRHNFHGIFLINVWYHIVYVDSLGFIRTSYTLVA